MQQNYYVYILTNKSGTLYIGITNNLKRRMYEHREKRNQGFSSKYNIDKLVFFEHFNPTDAIHREKQLKKWGRRKKIALIMEENPDWRDLSLSWDYED